MRNGAPSAVLAAAASYRVRVESYLGADLLASEVPVVGGSYTVDAASKTLESATLVVPAFADGRSWVPGADTRHPLGRFGQELALTAVMSDGLSTWETPLGRVRVDSWNEDGGDVEVRASGIMARVRDARLTVATVPRKDGTLESELRRLIIGGIPVDVDSALVDRSCPSSFQWDVERIDAVYDIADSWPALLVPDGTGGIRLMPEMDNSAWSAALEFSDNEGGTVVAAPRDDTRDGVYNHVVASSQSSEADAAEVSGEAFVTTGAYATSGPYGDVPMFYKSPMLTTDAQCVAAAEAMLVKALRPSRSVTVTTPVDPRVELFDGASVTFDYAEHHGWITGYTMPLVPGDMQITVSVFESLELRRPSLDRPSWPVSTCRLVGPTGLGYFIPLGSCWAEADGLYEINSLVSEDTDGLFVEV